MDSSFRTPIVETKRKAQFSEVVSSIITYRQKGLQTLIFHSLAILLSVTILFLLSQIYYIFLPCLKALLWALLCGSALYPFKIRLESFLRDWLNDLNQTNKSFCFGCLFLPFQIIIYIYFWTIQFISRNKFLFFLFHFRFQIGDVVKMCIILLPISSLKTSIIPAFLLSCISVHLVIILCDASQSISQLVFSFNFIPTVLLMTLVYSLNHFGLIGEVVLIFLFLLSLIGFMITIYNFLHGFQENHVIHEELKTWTKVFDDDVRSRVKKWVNSIRKKFSLSQDSVDGQGMNIGKLFIALLFTISMFAMGEHMNISNLILTIFCIHLVLKKILNILITEKLFDFIQWIRESIKICWNLVAEKFKKDVLFQILVHFFKQGDHIIKTGLQKSLDPLTSIALFLIVALMIIVFSVFLSIKIYRECYQAIHMLQNELKNIEFIQESINMTLNKISDTDYLNNMIFNDKFELRDDEKAFMNKMLLEFGNNILLYFNHTSRLQQETDKLIISVNNESLVHAALEDQTLPFVNTDPSSSFRYLFRLNEFKNFNQIINFISTQATSYLPLLKSFLSFSYAFIFVILDSSSFLLSFVLNFIIFALALFYLLSSSHKKYKPIEFLDHIVGNLVTNKNENKFSHYVEEVINSIFAATIKISAFYGVYTWLVHSLFNIQICCIPSVVAAILAAIPLLNAYWASLPACIYLYYFDPNLPLVKSVSMFLIAILPSFIVDSSIYSDIEKGGHPYLTGLAITCGVVYYGVEGALFGPLWLCLLFIILNMCTELDTTILKNLTP